MKRILPLLLLVGSCSNGDAGDPSAVDAAPPGATTHALIDNYLWQITTPEEDPFYAEAGDKPEQCEVEDLTVEDFPDGPWFDVNTRGCAYLTVHQASLGPIPAGSTIALRIWHFAITVAQGPFYLAVSVGEPPEIVWETTVDAPTLSGALLHDKWAAEKDYPTGTPIYWHLSNHGDNTWSFIEFSATYE